MLKVFRPLSPGVTRPGEDWAGRKESCMKKQVKIIIEETSVKILQKFAKLEGKTQSEVAEEAIIDYIKRNIEKYEEE